MNKPLFDKLFREIMSTYGFTFGGYSSDNAIFMDENDQLITKEELIDRLTDLRDFRSNDGYRRGCTIDTHKRKICTCCTCENQEVFIVKGLLPKRT